MKDDGAEIKILITLLILADHVFFPKREVVGRHNEMRSASHSSLQQIHALSTRPPFDTAGPGCYVSLNMCNLALYATLGVCSSVVLQYSLPRSI